jgi:DNA replication and repair protein RecF
MRAENDPRLLETTLDIDEDGKRSYVVNGQPRHRLSDVAGVLPAVVFTPDDLTMVKGPAERRRSAIDDLGEQISPTYGSLRRDYGRVVKQRNALLKDGVQGAPMDVWDEQVVSLGSRLVIHRLGLLERTMAHASTRYAEMTGGEALDYSYMDRCGLATCSLLDQQSVADAIREQLIARRAEERRRVTTLVGPHRDDIALTVGGNDARSFGSQGQQRTVALAWKLAEVAMVEEVLRRKPVLLLDDVMSELDADRRDALSQVVAGEIQTVVTTTNVSYFSSEILKQAAIVPIERRRT